MKTSVYKLTSPAFPGGAIYVCYKLGALQALDLADAQLSTTQRAYLLAALPVVEAELEKAQLGKMVIQPMPERTAKDKIVLFCLAYKEYRQVTYHATQNERSNIRTVPVSKELLKTFFESPLQDFSIRNYINRINITRDQLKNGRDPKTRFPSGYDKAFYNSLTGEALTAYRKHLRDNGWVYDASRGWVEKD
ncbi:hypothetical protein [Hymenobacter sp. B81]|uniref:hypothetical protein n=1 Tax=Hymenobacter sp. B81 TaxID=3344878 RepID=UPI0037DCE73F